MNTTVIAAPLLVDGTQMFFGFVIVAAYTGLLLMMFCYVLNIFIRRS